jgi:hypothetical protein
VSTNLNVLNKGNKPTFTGSNRQEVTDLTLGTDNIGDLLSNWHVSDETSLSVHRYILFQAGDLEILRVTYCNPKRTNWESYWEDLKVNLGFVPNDVHSVWDTELAVDLVQDTILSSYHQYFPARVVLLPRTVPWWNEELSYLKASTRWLFNPATRTGDWESYRMVPTCYNKEIRKAKWSSWTNHCWGIKDVPDKARLMMILASHLTKRMESIKLPDGQYTQSGRDPEGAIQVSISRV